jgi:NADH dehydrogenase
MPVPVATVFGGTGFIGRHVIRRLARQGVRVRVATRRPDRALFLKPMGDVGQIVPLAVRYGDDASLARSLDGADWVINLVGILIERPGQRFEALHARLPGRLGALAQRAGATRFVQLSSIGADLASPAAYARTKAAGELAAREAFPAVTVLRPSVVFGPEDDFFNLLGALSRLMPAFPVFFAGLPRLDSAEGLLRLHLPAAGAARLQPVYVGDVADAALAVLNEPRTAGATYELGGPTVYTFKALIELALEVVARRRWLVPVPYALLEAAAFVAQAIPYAPLNPDTVRLMKLDNVVTPGAPGLEALGITPTAAELILPTYLHVYRVGRVAPPSAQA